jgi:hypothetical protein
MAGYALSQIYGVSACEVGCFKDETAFAGGDGSSGSTRAVNVQYSTSGAQAFPSASVSKLSNALNGAMNDWNTKTDGTSTTPYNFRSTPSGSKTDVQVVFVEDLPKAKNGREVCMQLKTVKNRQTNAIESATLYIPRKVLEKSSEQDLKELIEHELGHVIGLDDYYGNAEQCETIMAQAEDGCTGGLKGSEKIASKDVAKSKAYVNGTGNCKGDRKPAQPVMGGGGGGYVDPNPVPYYYPQTCYYFYDAVDVFVFCDCNESGSPRGYRYVGTVYYLTDVFCTY